MPVSVTEPGRIALALRRRTFHPGNQFDQTYNDNIGRDYIGEPLALVSEVCALHVLHILVSTILGEFLTIVFEGKDFSCSMDETTCSREMTNYARHVDLYGQSYGTGAIGKSESLGR